MGLGTLILRATLGGYFFGHGMQKLAGWFGGGGPDRTGEMFEQIGLKPGRESAILAARPGRDRACDGRGAASASYLAERGEELFAAHDVRRGAQPLRRACRCRELTGSNLVTAG